MGRPKGTLSRQSTTVGRGKGRRARVSGFRKKRQYKKKRKPTIHPSLRPLVKCQKFAGHDDMSLFGSVYGSPESNDPKEWYIFNPLMLNRINRTVPSDTDRQSNQIFARNSRAEFQFIPSKRCIQGFQVRVAWGYFKGDDNKGTQGLVSNDLKVIYPEIHTKLKTKQNPATDDFAWKGSRTVTFIPRQIYDENGSDDATGAESMVALWTPKNINVNFPYWAKKTYEGADGDSLNGWNPIIALQCKPLEGGTQFSRPTLPASADAGSNPSPRIHSNMSTYFSDMY